MIQTQIAPRLSYRTKHLATAELCGAFVGAEHGSFESKVKVFLDQQQNATKTECGKVIVLLLTLRGEGEVNFHFLESTVIVGVRSEEVRDGGEDGQRTRVPVHTLNLFKLLERELLCIIADHHDSVGIQISEKVLLFLRLVLRQEPMKRESTYLLSEMFHKLFGCFKLLLNAKTATVVFLKGSEANLSAGQSLNERLKKRGIQ